MANLDQYREQIRRNHLVEEQAFIKQLTSEIVLSDDVLINSSQKALNLVKTIRQDGNSDLMEIFMAEYGLSTDEGVALMCLAEALLRVPDTDTIDALIEDKIAPSSWNEHLGKSSSVLVNASTWGLMLTGKVLEESGQGMASTLRKAVKRLGEPVIRSAIKRAMQELGEKFVHGETIDKALQNSKKFEKQGYTYSYDMLGEAALTEEDAKTYFNDYKNAIERISANKPADNIRQNPGISIKLSALHPRYFESQRERVMTELVETTLKLAKQACDAGIGLNIDAEEAFRLDLSLDVIEAVLSAPELKGWDGFGVVVQAYSKRAPAVIDWLYALAEKCDRKIMLRLVKGAYWDTEIKLAQVLGSENFPVFTQKHFTDICYLCCAQKLLNYSDRIYPQFATHNAHTVAAIIEMADDLGKFEFQRLHGMGDSLYKVVKKNHDIACRIYAPVGEHEDLLAYLVRRLLENGANSSFVNQLLNEDVAPEKITRNPYELIDSGSNTHVLLPADLYQPERENSKGWDLDNLAEIAAIDSARAPYINQVWEAEPIIAGPTVESEPEPVYNPANLDDHVGSVKWSQIGDVETALAEAKPWDASAEERASILLAASKLYEEHFGELFAVLMREAGKTPLDAIAELREAVDFLRYYAVRGTELEQPARGLISCISPWNFPLAIFTGQLAAALSAGNAVLAKPANPTALTAYIAVKLLHKAGVPVSALQLLPGSGAVVGSKLTSDSRIDGVCFTGSTATAQTINRTMAENMSPSAPLIAETGGINAMIVDSTALPEQTVIDIITSAFQSAGQRCSALRVLYLQEDVANTFLAMLYGAMDELIIANPWHYNTDIGPVITETARAEISDYIAAADKEGRLLKQLDVPANGYFVGPAVIKVTGIADLEKEIFGPVLHVATYKARELDQVVDAINQSGYGLTFGMHSRIDDRIEKVTRRLQVGNMYVNRNQIGAIVGSQPFGGEGLSGTGPKAGGPNYVRHFSQPEPIEAEYQSAQEITFEQAQQLLILAQNEFNPVVLDSVELPGPTGESNHLSIYSRGVVLCLGASAKQASEQAKIAADNGCVAVTIAPGANGHLAFDGVLPRDMLATLSGFAVVALYSDEADLRQCRHHLAKRDGLLIPLVTDAHLASRCHLERHICIDTTAAGGNTKLMAQAEMPN